MPDDVLLQLLCSHNFVPMLTAHQARESDAYTINHVGIPQALLMENAGAAVARAVQHVLNTLRSPKIIVVAGPGNNGADAIVAARHLLACNVVAQIYFVADETSFSAELSSQISLLRSAIKHQCTPNHEWFPKHPLPPVRSDCVIIDGIFGAGLSRPPQGKPAAAIAWINSLRHSLGKRCYVVSVDIPSGIALEAVASDYNCVTADLTVSFGYLKRAHCSEPTKSSCGKSIAINIGLLHRFAITNYYHSRRRALLILFKTLTNTSHKGLFGHVLIFEGHTNFLGASRLAARAALRIGAGLVTIATDSTTRPLPYDIPEFMHIARPDITSDFINRIDALVIGPGLSADASWQNKAREFIARWHHALGVVVLDADGLKLLASNEPALKHPIIIATPHPKEAAAILGITKAVIENDRFKAIEALGALSADLGHKTIWVLKGATTLVRSLQGTIFAFRGDAPILSTGGSGDVLSGAIAGCIGQTDSPLAATLLAVSVQIESAVVLSRQTAKGIVASEIADIFPLVTKNRPRAP